MVQLIISIIFLVSLLGMLFIMFKKAPLLAQLPKNGSAGFKKHKLIANIENKIKAHHFHLFEKQMLLHRLLSFMKIWILKTETKIDHTLHGIRKKAQELDKKTKGKK